MLSKKKETLAVLSVFFLLLTLFFVRVQIAQNKHIMYFVPELDLYIRLSPDWYAPEGEILAFSREKEDLKTKNSKVLAIGQDNLRFTSSLCKGNAFLPTINVKIDSSYTFYSTGIPHSVSIPMEELFEARRHHQSPEMQQLLSESPAFSIYYSDKGLGHRELFSYDDRLTFVELERFFY